MEVMIIGGGIGGLATALSLHAAGIPARVFESVPEIRPLGVGINLLPHAVRELTELGLQDTLAETAIATESLTYFSKRGRRIWREPRGLDAGYNWPQFSIHRGELQMMLLQAARERLGADRILTGRHLSRFEQDADGVTAWFVGPGDDEPSESRRADVMVAADGIHSAVRRHYHSDEGPPKWNGAILWRATTEAEPFVGGASMIMAGHQAQKFVAYPISRSAADRGRSLVNWIAELRFDDRDLLRREDWNRPGRLEDFLPAFEPWRFDWLDVPALIRGADAVYEFPMVDRDPLSRWSDGRVTLLGDAAHPMYPIGSNGASQAIVDARVLAHALATAPDPVQALHRYEEARLPATARIVLANRGNGPEQVMQIVEDRAPDGFDRLDDVITTEELQSVARAYKQVAGFSRDDLNTRPSLSVSPP